VVTSGEFRCLGQETMAIELFLHCNVKIWLRWETRAPDAGAFRRAMKGEIDFGEPAKILFVYLGEVKIQPPFLEADVLDWKKINTLPLTRVRLYSKLT